MQILVLGMHRSGTSLSTRIINMMGAYVGAPGMLLSANPDNPKGFWERHDVLHINRNLLQANGCSWYRVDRWDDNNITIAPAIRQSIRQTLAEMNPNQPWVMKDPRLCITLPVWMPYLQAPVAVIATRNPMEVAHSLKLRNGMPLEYGLALWEYHAVSIIRHAHALPKVFTTYDAMLTNPLAATRALCDALSDHMHGLHLPSEENVLAYITPSLRRAHAPEGSPTACQQNLYAMLLGEAPFDAGITVSDASVQIMKQMGAQVSGAPVAH